MQSTLYTSHLIIVTAFKISINIASVYGLEYSLRPVKQVAQGQQLESNGAIRSYGSTIIHYEEPTWLAHWKS